MKIIVIGAGIFGITIALELSKRHDVTLVDANNDIMQNASKVNHNRLHFGFHYPRSRATALQSLEGYELFYDYFRGAITLDFPNYYMIEKNSHVTSRYYEQFCFDLNLSYKEQYPDVDMNLGNIKSSYLVKEPIFDYDLIKLKLEKALIGSNIYITLNKKITSKPKGYDVVINTTYFNLNKINRLYNLPEMKLRLQAVIIPILECCNTKRIGVTIMDGKFCSIMPKGFSYGKFLLYHAKESIIYETENETIPDKWLYGKRLINNQFIKDNIYDRIVARQHINKILTASQQYFRFLKDSTVVDYWQTVRALPINNNDERLSIFEVAEKGNQKIISVLSGKISTCLLIANNISKLV